MKKYFLFLFIIALSSCENELVVSADQKEVPVIYGVLDQNESQHYIQIFKGFLNEETNALTIAKDPDVLFYDDAVVDLQIERNGQAIMLQRVDLSQMNLPRNPGIFVTSPNYAYVFSEPLNVSQEYLLTFKNKNTGHTATASTRIVHDFNVTRPLTGNTLNFHTQNNINVLWKAAQNAKVYQLVMRFYFEEWNVDSPGDVDTNFVDWKIFDDRALPQTSCCSNNDVSCCNSMDTTINGTKFYPFLKVNLQSNPSIRRRALEDPIEFIFTLGADDLYSYIRSGSAQTGITSLSVQNDFTNIQNGLGIFSSRYNKIIPGVKMADRSLDSLSCGSSTKDLNFVNHICD